MRSMRLFRESGQTTLNRRRSEKTDMTLRGYSAVLEEAQIASPSREEREPIAAPSADHDHQQAERTRSRTERPTRPQWPIGDGLGLRPSSLAARQALSGVTKAASNIDQHLALIEMLVAVGPEVREQGTLDETLRVLAKMEDEFSKRVAELLRACGAVRADCTAEP
jgi:hypothetical protein